MNCTCKGDRLGHPGSWTCTCSDESYYAPRPSMLTLVHEKQELEAENARLRAELDALKPKPVVEYRTYLTDFGKVQLTFTDGRLTSAEVIK